MGDGDFEQGGVFCKGFSLYASDDNRRIQGFLSTSTSESQTDWIYTANIVKEDNSNNDFATFDATSADGVAWSDWTIGSYDVCGFDISIWTDSSLSTPFVNSDFTTKFRVERSTTSAFSFYYKTNTVYRERIWFQAVNGLVTQNTQVTLQNCDYKLALVNGAANVA